MKILKTFLLVIYSAIVNAEDTFVGITLDVRVAEYKDADANDALIKLAAPKGESVLWFLAAGNIQVT